MRKIFKTATMTMLMLAGATITASAQTVIRGVEYREITDLGQPRVTRAQPQLGSTPLVASVTPRYAQYAPPVTPQPNVVWPAQVPAVADQRPTLNAFGQPTQPNLATYNRPYAYGYGYANGCSWGNNAGYANTLPPAQPYTNVQPIGGIQPVGGYAPAIPVQPLPGGPVSFNPYQGAQRSTPWRPIVPIRSMPANIEVGQGIIGQPKVYVTDQPVRNFIRYITP